MQNLYKSSNFITFNTNLPNDLLLLKTMKRNRHYFNYAISMSDPCEMLEMLFF